MRGVMSWMKRELRASVRRPIGFAIGVVFTIAAIAAIQYDETVAPRLSSFADGITGATGELARRFG